MGVFPGAFNPLTNAHVALAKAARTQYALDQVAFVLPSKFPHKEFSEASFEARLGMLQAALRSKNGFLVCSSPGGLFIEIHQGFRAVCGAAVEIYFLCGRDAAERIVNWDYGDGLAIEEQLKNYQLLVAWRGKEYEPPPELRERIHTVDLTPGYDELSSTRVREAIQNGEPWRPTVPEEVAAWIERKGLYKAS